eukprot:357723-Chlamydomonas_euryale.AAC.30
MAAALVPAPRRDWQGCGGTVAAANAGRHGPGLCGAVAAAAARQVAMRSPGRLWACGAAAFAV